jgi:hypothetical protein
MKRLQKEKQAGAGSECGYLLPPFDDALSLFMRNHEQIEQRVEDVEARVLNSQRRPITSFNLCQYAFVPTISML